MSSSIEKIRHSTAHILAAAVQKLYPQARFGIGPVIENGFYYDFDLDYSFKPADLVKIEREMKKLIKADLKFEKKQIPVKEALELFKKLKQPYKVELIKDLIKNEKVKEVSIYQTNGFIDLCKGPHLSSSREINPEAFKLTKLAGAYWRGDEKNKMLQRIYGLGFENRRQLEDYLEKEKQIEKRDHRRLNQILNLYLISDEIGAGLIILQPKGAIILEEITQFWKAEHQKRGYQYIQTPHIGKLDLWKKSGHWDFYKEYLYQPITIEGVEYLLKPMNCPFHLQVYKSQNRSYRQLPLRYCELGTVYRYEKSGTLHGLLRARGFTQDDAHIFCRPEQTAEEIEAVLDLAILMLQSFGFKKYQVELAVRDPQKKSKYLGDDRSWDKAEKALAYALKKKKIKYSQAKGEAVFYGPKIDFKLIDSLGRGWQGPTIQLDFNFPEKFNLTYVDQKGKKKRPVMIHRTVLGSVDARFLANLLEHYAGALPLWLAPEQVWVIPVAQGHKAYAQKVAQALRENHFRLQVIDSHETVSKKIRQGEIEKIPYLLVVGDQEEKTGTVRLRQRQKGDLGAIPLKKIIKKLIQERKEKL